MSVKLRLRRMGKKKQPFYRIVAIDSRVSRGGRYLENVGYYNPLKSPVELKVDEERTLYWLGEGAIPSDTVRSFLKREGILLKWHLMRQGAEDEKIRQAIEEWQGLQGEKDKRNEALREQKRREKETAEKTEAETVEANVEDEVVAEEKTEAAPEVKANNSEETNKAPAAETEPESSDSEEAPEKQ